MKSRIQEILESGFDFENYTAAELGRIFNYDYSKIRKKLTEKGIVLKNGNDNAFIRKAKQKQQKIILLNSENHTNLEIRDLTGFSLRYIKTILSDNKIPSVKVTQKRYELSFDEEAVITGLLLGDGHITNDCFRGGESRLSIKHSLSQEEYLKYLINSFTSFTSNDLVHTTVVGLRFKERKKNNKEYYNINWRTKSNVYFSELRKKWYPDGVRQVPTDIKLCSRSLAVWFMDDGTSTPYNVVFCTNSFSKESCEILQKALLELGLESGIWFTNRKEYMVYIKASHIPLFIKIVHPHICTSMLYKLQKLNKWGIYCELTGTSLEPIQPSLASNS